MRTFPCRLWLWILLPLLLEPSPLRAQGSTQQGPSLAEQQALAAEQVRQQATERILATSGIPLEGALDPDGYVVGPGDVFSVSIGGGVPLLLTPVVTADGLLVVSELGSVDVAGLTLAEARARVNSRLQAAYRNVPVDVALASPRQFYVHVAGEVARPGRHVAVPVARVEDALTAAMGGVSPLQALDLRRAEAPNAPLPALRNVEVRRQDGTVLSVDLLRYYASGELDQNPYLRDGDALYVPSFTLTDRALILDNGSATELVDFRAGDRLTDLLRVAGLEPRMVERVRLTRTQPGGRLVTTEHTPSAIAEGEAEDPLLRPLDRVQVLVANRVMGVAQTEGEVVQPGSYPIVVGETTLRDLVEAAGGITRNGLLRAAYLERREPTDGVSSLGDPMDDGEEGAEQEGGRSPLQTSPPKLETFEEARLSALPFGSRQYVAREMREFQRVSIDLEDGAIPEIPLRSGDRFVVPRDPGAVLVIGQVRRPGYVPYQAGASADDYIAAAGGRGPAATEVFVREADSGQFRAPSAGPILTGDAVFVDRRLTADTESLQSLALQEKQLDFQQDRERADRRFQYVQASLAVVSTVVGVITTYLLIQERTSTYTGRARAQATPTAPRRSGPNA